MSDAAMSDETVGEEAVAAAEEELKWPAGFITVLVLAALYLGWRLVQGFMWIFDQIA